MRISSLFEHRPDLIEGQEIEFDIDPSESREEILRKLVAAPRAVTAISESGAKSIRMYTDTMECQTRISKIGPKDIKI